MLAVLIGVFVAICAAVVAVGLVLQRRATAAAVPEGAGPAEPGAANDLLPTTEPATVADTLRRLGEAIPVPNDQVDSLRMRLMRAGYRDPFAVALFQGARLALVGCLAILFAFLSLLQGNDLSAIFISLIAGCGLGYMAPERWLDRCIRKRGRALRRSLPNALDLLVLTVEAGYSLDHACMECARQLRVTAPELAEEFRLVHLELRAGQSREEALRNLHKRNGELELRKLSNMLVDTDRFGTNLAPALRTHGRYLRTRLRQQAQEQARKIGVKLVFPLVLLIFPSMLLVTLGPALLRMQEAFKTLMK